MLESRNFGRNEDEELEELESFFLGFFGWIFGRMKEERKRFMLSVIARSGCM